MGKNNVEIVVTAEDKAGGTLKGIGGALGGIGRVAAGAAVAGVGALVGGFALAGGAAINMNAQLESSTLQFETLMGDSDRARAHVESLFDFAAKTPFETGPIIEASRVMQVFGGDALNTDENLTLVGDTAAAVGAPIEDIGFWVGRAYAAIQGGQPFGEAAQNLMQMGAVSPDVIAEMNRLSDSGASADEIFGVLQGHMGEFAGAMEKQAGTWEGLKATISDSFNMMAANALKPFFELAKTGMASLAAWLNDPAVQAGIQNIAQGFTDLIGRVAAFVTEQVIPFVQQHGEQLKTILIAVGSALGGLAIIGTVVGWVTGLIGVVTGAAAAFAAAGGGIAGVVAILGGPVTLVVAAVAGLIALFAAAWRNNWGDIQGKVHAAWAFIQPILAAVAEWVGVHVRAGIEQLRAFWVDTAWPAIQNAVAIVWPVIQGIFAAIRDFVVGILIPTIQTLWQKWTQEWWPTIQTVLQNVWTIIKGIWEELGRWINDNIVPWVQFLHDKWVNEVWPAIQGAIETAWAIIQPIWEAIRAWAAETLPPVIEALQGIFEGVMSGISAAIQPVRDIWNGFVDAVTGFWEWIKNKVFNFEIHLPDLPDWALPGSPLPIHTAWAAFAADMPSIAAELNAGPIGAREMPAARAATQTTVVNIDARGAARGVDRDIRRVVEDVMREYGVKADLRMRTA